jgi:hypothetical protein
MQYKLLQKCDDVSRQCIEDTSSKQITEEEKTPLAKSMRVLHFSFFFLVLVVDIASAVLFLQEAHASPPHDDKSSRRKV